MDINHLDRFKATVASGKTAIGAVVSMDDLAVSECAGDCGMDFVWIDSEHAPHTLSTIKGHVTACRGTGCAPFVRVAKNDVGVLKPVLDLAPAAVIIPMVNSVEEAEYAVATCRYPKTGVRGAGVRRATKYGATDIFEYLKTSESEPLVIIQIEHIDAVKNLDAILKVPGIDSICVGPCDLSGSMGILCQMDHPELNKVVDEVCAKTKKAGLMLGTAGGPYAAWKHRDLDWIALGSDWGAMAQGFRAMLKEGERF